MGGGRLPVTHCQLWAACRCVPRENYLRRWIAGGKSVTSMNRLVGLPVICQGRRLGQVEQAVLQKSGKKLLGIVVRNGIRGAKWLKITDIQTIGGVSILSRGSLEKLPPEAGFTLGQVQDTSGLRLGQVTDVYLDPETSQVAALEVSTGPIDDLLHGRWICRDFVVRTPNPVRNDSSQGLVLIPCGGMRPLKQIIQEGAWNE